MSEGKIDGEGGAKIGTPDAEVFLCCSLTQDERRGHVIPC